MNSGDELSESFFRYKVEMAGKQKHKFKSLREAEDFYSDLREEINKRMILAPKPFYGFGRRPVATDMRRYTAARRALPYKLIGVDEAASMDDDFYDSMWKIKWRNKDWFERNYGKKKEEKHMFFKKLWRSIEGLETSVEKLHKHISGDGIQHSTVSSEGTYYSRDLGLKQRVSSLESKEPDTIDCHTCGCVVRKEIAFRGHDRIEREEIFEPSTPISGFHDSKEVVHETWYCKLHKKGKNEYGSE